MERQLALEKEASKELEEQHNITVKHLEVSILSGSFRFAVF